MTFRCAWKRPTSLIRKPTTCRVNSKNLLPAGHAQTFQCDGLARNERLPRAKGKGLLLPVTPRKSGQHLVALKARWKRRLGGAKSRCTDFSPSRRTIRLHSLSTHPSGLCSCATSCTCAIDLASPKILTITSSNNTLTSSSRPVSAQPALLHLVM